MLKFDYLNSEYQNNFIKKNLLIWLIVISDLKTIEKLKKLIKKKLKKNFFHR